MKRLRSGKKRFDGLRTEARPRKRGRIGRYVYLAFIGVFALSLFDFLAGDLVYLRADGMVSQSVAIVGPEYPGTVLSLEVAPGDHVVKGQAVARMRSQDMLRDIADLAAQVATADARLGELRIQRRKIASLIPEAGRMAAETGEHRKKIERLEREGLVTTNRSARADASAYDALEDLKELETEAGLVEAELERFRTIAERTRRALGEVEAVYDEGVLRAVESGMVGNVLVAPGDGVATGQRMAEVFHGPHYVLAYVPVGALYEVEPGDEVAIRVGFHTLSGQVEGRRPLAHRLPQEFQRQFRTVERMQLVRIRLTEGVAPPLFTEVEVTWPNSIRAVLASAANALVAGSRDAMQTLYGQRDTGQPEAQPDWH